MPTTQDELAAALQRGARRRHATSHARRTRARARPAVLVDRAPADATRRALPRSHAREGARHRRVRASSVATSARTSRAEGDDVTSVDSHRAGRGPSTSPTPPRSTRRSRDAEPDVVYHLAARSHVGESWRDGDLLTARQRRRHRATCSTPVAVAACAASIVVGQRRAVRRGRRRTIAASRKTSAAGADHPVRREQGRGRGGSRSTAFRDHGARRRLRARVQPHRSGPGADVPGPGPRRSHRRRRARRRRRDRGGQPRPGARLQRRARRRPRLPAARRARRTRRGLQRLLRSGSSVAELAGALLAQCDAPADRSPSIPSLVRPVDVPVLVGDPTKLVAATGWQPDARPRRDTLADVLECARRRQHGLDSRIEHVPSGTWRSSQPSSVAIARGS